ncbi:MAG: hypothetical protein D6731_11805 [Planctomycetota bacterium]|nr:MAG: hypothetical protein D6731_11805 [Planctomycetota bacterium]
MRRRFTLLEIMLAVALTATVLAMIGGVLLSVINTTENATEQLATEKAGYGILNTFQRDLAGVYAYALGGLAFEGKRDELHFVTTADVYVDEDGRTPKFVEVGYRLADGENGVKILYRRASPLEGDPIRSEVAYAELFGRLHELELQYLDAEGEWQEAWDDPAALPRAVKIKVELALDEAQRDLQQRGLIDVSNPVYEMIVGLPVALGPSGEEAASGVPSPPGGG